MFQPIGQVVESKIQQQGLTRSILAAIVIAQATNCGQGRWQATRFRLGRLTLVAASAIAAQELQLRRIEIINEINQSLGESLVAKLIIRS